MLSKNSLRNQRDGISYTISLCATETCAEVQVQNLLDYTAKRMVLHLGEIPQHLSVLISKYGYDGTQQMQFKMKFENEAYSDANMFQNFIVPIQLVRDPKKNTLAKPNTIIISVLSTYKNLGSPKRQLM